MAETQSARVQLSLLFEVLQATAMLLFTLSSIASNRRKQWDEKTGSATTIALPGLPELLCLEIGIIRVPDEDLYGPRGTAAQMAYTGWIAGVYARWEHRYRRDLKESLAEDAILPEMDAFGDLMHVRNDLLHNNGRASADHCGKCTILKWFSPGDRMVFETRHLFDLLNQIGALSLGSAHDPDGRACVFRAQPPDVGEFLRRTTRPRIVSVRTHHAGWDADPPYKGVTVVFDDGLFTSCGFTLERPGQWEELGEASIDSLGNLVFADGTVQDSSWLYRDAATTLKSNKGPVGGAPIPGPWMLIRR